MRTVFRLLFVVAGMWIVGQRAFSAGRDWREWHQALGDDPPAAHAWRTLFFADVGSAALALAAILLFLAILRQLDRRPR